jgi:hypothetical protein
MELASGRPATMMLSSLFLAYASGRPAMMMVSSLFLAYASAKVQSHKSRATARGSCHLS